MDTENTPRISASRSSLFTETGGIPSILDWELLLWALEPLAGMERGDRLFGGGDEVLFIFADNLG